MSNITDNKLPLTNIQKLIGGYMLQSKLQMPCCYLKASVNITELVNTRKSYCKAVGVRVTTNDFFFGAIARAIEKFPLMAGRLSKGGEYIRIASHNGIGFAVSAPQGLVVPVIKAVIGKSLPEIAEQSNILLKKARANKLMPDDFYGANIVMSSLGMYGVDSFFAIAPPGATGVISIGRIAEAIVPVNGDMMAQKMMAVSLAVNNRIINDFYAAEFLKHVITTLENPTILTRTEK